MVVTILTGLNGTVAPVLAAELRGSGCEVLAWDRGAVSPDDREGVARHIRDVKPSAMVHCAMGSPQWAEDMARVCAEEGSRFLYVSSASVYGTQQQGPFTIEDTPEPSDDYGRYKLECERRVLAANDQAIVVRIGWQMALRRGGNNMVEHLAQKQAESGYIAASTEWFPACSFLEDTARALAGLLEGGRAGLYLLDGNPGYNFWEIAAALNQALAAGWEVRESKDFQWNNRMVDDRAAVSSIFRSLSRPNTVRAETPGAQNARAGGRRGGFPVRDRGEIPPGRRQRMAGSNRLAELGHDG